MLLKRALIGLVAAGVALAPGLALAHPTLDEADGAYRAAEHSRALALLGQARDRDDLSRDDLVALLVLEARVNRSLRREEAVEAALFQLAHLAPDLELGREVPRALRRRFDALRAEVSERVQARGSAAWQGARARVSAEVAGDVAGLAMGFRIHARPEGGTWRSVTDAELTLEVPPALGLEFWVEVVGPGGAPIATDGSAQAPGRLEARGAPAAASVATGGGEVGATEGGSDDGGGLEVWPFLVAGGAVLLVGAVVLVVALLTVPGSDTDWTAGALTDAIPNEAPTLVRF